MQELGLGFEEVLTTTRAVRKRLDFERPIEQEVLDACVEIALQAPTGSNAENWHFLFVTDPERRRGLAELYRRAFEVYRRSPGSIFHLAGDAKEKERAKWERSVASVEYLNANLERVPVLLVPCVEAPRSMLSQVIGASVLFGSILPAVWSFMLAARSRGLGTCFTSAHLMHEREAADLLDIPFESVIQTALVPVAYTLGTGFRPAKRRPLGSVVHRDRW